MERFNRTKIAEGVHFSTIFDDRFKTSRISVYMVTDIDKDKCLANIAASWLLARSCREYPSFRELGCKLDSLYGMHIMSGTTKIGDHQVVNISTSFINDEYSLDGKSIYEEAAKLMCGVLFEPNVTDGAFSDEDFMQEQRQLDEALDAQFNDKRAYAKRRFTEIMFKDEKCGVDLCGSKELVAALTSEEAYNAYLELLKITRVEIICLGSSSTDKVKDIFTQYFSGLKRDVVFSDNEIVLTAGETKHKTDSMDVVQSKLMLGYRTGCAEPDERATAFKLMSAVLGGTAHSKLFNNVREKLSLCYYCMSSYDAQKGALFIESGVEHENVEKTKQAIMNEINEMIKGNITDEEIAAAKLSMANSYETTVDTPTGTIAWYFSEILKETYKTPAERTAMINAVTKEEIVEAAKGLTLDTVYVLTGNGKESESDE